MQCIRPVRFVEGERRLVAPAWQPKHDPEKCEAVFLATNASVCAEIMLKR
jgi:hypothetical protein